MRNAAPMTFGARLAARRFTKEEIAWFFNVPPAIPNDAAPLPIEPGEADDRVQIGPLDV
ncbi:hypothetical protein ABE485_06190 [Achromobacter spanius]|uniref:hypothetical protein n=1 Tax=Achromobacter spanius TaxID=217203 RepID=UPI00320B3E92